MGSLEQWVSSCSTPQGRPPAGCPVGEARRVCPHPSHPSFLGDGHILAFSSRSAGGVRRRNRHLRHGWPGGRRAIARRGVARSPGVAPAGIRPGRGDPAGPRHRRARRVALAARRSFAGGWRGAAAGPVCRACRSRPRAARRARPRDADQPRRRRERVPYRVRRHEAALRRGDDRELAQHALRRDPECRCVARRAAIARWRSAGENERRWRGLLRAAGGDGGAARWRDGAHRRRAAAGADAAVVPARQDERRQASDAPGRASRPHGAEWYAWGLRAGTTTWRSPQEIHALGRAQLVDLQARMDVILKGFGLTHGSVVGRARSVAYLQGRSDAIRPRLPRAFRRRGKGNLEIRRLPLAQEPGAAAAYGGPGSHDGTIPGRIWVNLGDPSIHNKVTIPDLVFHEGIPGHVWQGEYAQQLPLIRSILAFNAYSEGWALYAEQLADELGMYDDDPAGRLGYLMGLSWRAVRLVVDPGIHALARSRCAL